MPSLPESAFDPLHPPAAHVIRDEAEALVVARPDNLDGPRTQKLAKALNADAVRPFILTRYKGQIAPCFSPAPACDAPYRSRLARQEARLTAFAGKPVSTGSRDQVRWCVCSRYCVCVSSSSTSLSGTAPTARAFSMLRSSP